MTLKYYLLTGLFFVVFPISSYAQSKENKGFVPLFNGKDLNNWNLKLRNGDSVLAALMDVLWLFNIPLWVKQLVLGMACW